MKKNFQIVFALAIGSLFFAVSDVQSQEAASRQIVLEEFTRARPAATTTTPNSRPPRNSGTVTNTRARYRRVTQEVRSNLRQSQLRDSELGITVWRLRPAKPEDDAGARLLVMEDAKPTQWTPERVEADTPLKVRDRVRISVESPRPGYLYVIDRERYADGSLGDAYLIFPTRRTRDGDNHVTAGKLIDIPAQEDDPNYFTLVPSPSRSDQTGELLTILVTPKALPLDITDKPLLISSTDLTNWERLWGTKFERFEMEGGAGMPWTKEEKEAAKAKGSHYLTQQQATPQTIYRLATAGNGSLLVNLNLGYRNH